jgi:hypothetical protein
MLLVPRDFYAAIALGTITNSLKSPAWFTRGLGVTLIVRVTLIVLAFCSPASGSPAWFTRGLGVTLIVRVTLIVLAFCSPASGSPAWFTRGLRVTLCGVPARRGDICGPTAGGRQLVEIRAHVRSVHPTMRMLRRDAASQPSRHRN